MTDKNAPPKPAAEPNGQIQTGALAGRSMASAIGVLALPVLVQQLLQAFVGMTDKVLAGHLAPGVRVEALDAIGIGSYVGWFVGIAMTGLGIGGQAIIARAMGAGRREEAHDALGQAMGVSFLWGAGVGAVLWMTAPALAEWTKLSPAAAVAFGEYMRVLAVSMPVAGVMLVGALCLYGAGETRAPALIAILINLVNAASSWALSGADIDLTGIGAPAGTVFENPFSFDLGVAGIAAGTSIGYLIGALATWWVLMRGVRDLRLQGRRIRPRRAMLARFLRVGIPNFAEGIAMWSVNLFVLMFIGKIALENGGAGLQGAHIVAIQWESFSFLPGFAIGTAAATLAGQYLGAGNPAMARRVILVCAGIASVLMGSIGIVLMTAGEALTRIITTESIHLEVVPKLLRICGMVQVALAVTMVFRQGLRGVGDTRWIFIITTFSSYAVRLPVSYYLGVQLGYGLEGIWYGLSGEFCVRAILFYARFAHGGWQRVRV